MLYFPGWQRSFVYGLLRQTDEDDWMEPGAPREVFESRQGCLEFAISRPE